MVCRVAGAALESCARPVVVVTGHAANSILAALKDYDLQFVHAEDHAEGQSCSLRKGVAVLPRDADGVVVLLADMPLISSTLIDELINVFETSPGAAAVVPTFAGRRGNPALLGRRLFPAIARLEADRGAGPLLVHAESVIEHPVANASIHVDVDTKEDLRRLRAESDRRSRPV